MKQYFADKMFPIKDFPFCITHCLQGTQMTPHTHDFIELVFVTEGHTTHKVNFEDENEFNHIIPFNLAYATSIHKAQGLEYNSVKVVITQNVEDRITKNIFFIFFFIWSCRYNNCVAILIIF